MKYSMIQLGEIADVTKLAGFEFSKYIQYVEDGEIIALRALNLRNGVLDLNDVKRIYKSVSDNLTRSKLYVGDILLTYTGNGYGDTAYIDENDKYHLAPNICKITAKNVDSIFLFQYVKSNIFKQQMRGNIGGSSQPTIPMKTIRQLLVPVPDKKTQKAIGRLLNAFDKKIESNNLINDNLLQQAQLIFKNYFINITDIPSGWAKGNLLDIADYLNGLAMQKYRPTDDEAGLPVLKIKELRQRATDDSSEYCSPSIKPEYIINDGDVVFSWSGSLLVDIWCGGICGLNQHLFKVTSNKYDRWFYYLWTVHHLERFIAIAADKATTMGHIKRGELSNAEVLIPAKEDYDKIGSLINPLINMIVSKRIENRKLASLRNELLPKLMSGEININEVTINE